MGKLLDRILRGGRDVQGPSNHDESYLPLAIGPLDDPELWVDAMVTGERTFGDTSLTFTKFRHQPNPERPEKVATVVVAIPTWDTDVNPEGLVDKNTIIQLRDIYKHPKGWRAKHLRLMRL